MEIELYDVEIRNKFHKSLENILRYIQGKSYKASLDFKKDIVTRISQICENPEAFPILAKYKTLAVFRYANFKGYQIYYRIEGEKIIIADIIHEKQNPNRLKYLDKI